jgi:hypothetical protein
VSVRYVPAPDKRWYVFRVSYGREDKASDYLVEDGTYTYIAKKMVEKYVEGKRKRYLQTLIPNLLFAYTTAEKAVVEKNGVIHLEATLTPHPHLKPGMSAIIAWGKVE